MADEGLSADDVESAANAGHELLASIGQRIGARLADWFLLLAVWLPVAALTADTSTSDTPDYPWWALAGWAGLVAVYEILFIAMRGQTPGKMLLGIEIVSMRAGTRVTVLQSVARVVPVIVAMAVLVVFFPIAMVFIYFSAAFMSDNRGVLDRLANTAVVQKAAGGVITNALG